MTIDLILSLVSVGGFTLGLMPFVADRYLSYKGAGRDGTLFIRPRPWERSLGLGIAYRHAYLQGGRKKALRLRTHVRDNPDYRGSAHVYAELGDTEARDKYEEILDRS